MTNDLTIEVNGLGTYGRNLITTDVINREFTTAGRRPRQSQSPGRQLSGEPGLFGLQRAHGCGALSLEPGIHSGLLHLEPLHRQPKRSTGGRFLRPQLHQHCIRQRERAGKRLSRSNSIPRATGETPITISRNNLVMFSYWNLPSALQGTKAGVVVSRLDRRGPGGFPLGLALHGDRQREPGDPWKRDGDQSASGSDQSKPGIVESDSGGGRRTITQSGRFRRRLGWHRDARAETL